MAEERPTTWDSEGRVIPLTEQESQRILREAARTDAADGPYIPRGQEARILRTETLVRRCHSFVTFQSLGGLLEVDLSWGFFAIVLGTLLLPIFILMMTVAFVILMFARFRLRKLRAGFESRPL